MPEEETITFEFIRKIQREEQHDPKLSKLPKYFYKKAKDYLNQKKKLLEKRRDRSISIEISNIERLLEDIFNRRETKLMNHAIITARTDIPPQNLTEEEKEFFEMLVDSLKKRREKSLSILFKKSKEKEGFETIMFQEDVSEFVGIDLKRYGPYKKGDVADIPNDNAKLLIKRGVAKKAV